MNLVSATFKKKNNPHFLLQEMRMGSCLMRFSIETYQHHHLKMQICSLQLTNITASRQAAGQRKLRTLDEAAESCVAADPPLKNRRFDA